MLAALHLCAGNAAQLSNVGVRVVGIERVDTCFIKERIPSGSGPATDSLVSRSRYLDR